jgi:hypothetical protein
MGSWRGTSARGIWEADVPRAARHTAIVGHIELCMLLYEYGLLLEMRSEVISEIRGVR